MNDKLASIKERKRPQVVNLAVIGCGHWGTRWIKIFSSLGASVKVCCDSDEERLKIAGEIAPYATLATDYREVIDRNDIEATYVATPPPSHYDVAKDLLLSGKHVLVEKPLSTSYEKGVELVKLAKEKNRVLMVGNTYLFNEAIWKLRELVESGTIGKLRHIHLWMTNSLDMWIGKDVYNYADVVWDLGPHPISIIAYVVKEWPCDITAFASKPLPQFNSNLDTITVGLHFSSGVTAKLYLNWLDYRRDRRILIIGEHGMIWCDDFSNKDCINVHMQQFDFVKGHINLGGHEVFQIDVRDTLIHEARQFVNCICANSSPISDGENGAQIVAVIEAIQQSINGHKG